MGYMANASNNLELPMARSTTYLGCHSRYNTIYSSVSIK